MTAESIDAVDAQQIATETHQGGTAPIPSVKRPETSDHKPKAKKKPKAKVKVVHQKDEKGKDVLDENGHPVPIGREITLHGVTVTVLDTALGDFETADDLSLMGEAAEEFNARGEDSDSALMEAASGRISPLLRRLVGYQGAREVLRTLRHENGGRVEFEHVTVFIGDLITALSPNS